MQEVEAGSVLNPDILISRKFGGLIWKKAGSQPIIPQVVPFTADKSWAAMEYMDKVRVERTGISTATAALDPEALQNQTATASQLQHDVNYSQIEFIARNQAELGWKKHFRKRLKLAIKHEQVRAIPSNDGDPVPAGEDGKPLPPGTQPIADESGQPMTVPGQFRKITPEKWSPDMRVSINVGLGTGSRDRDMMMLNGIMLGQREMAAQLDAAGFKSKALEFIPKIRMAAVKSAESTGLKNADSYYPEITEAEIKQMQGAASQPQPDPALALEEAKGKVTMQVEQGKNQLAIQQTEIESASQVRREEAQLQADLQVNSAKMQSEMMLEAERIASAERIAAANLEFQREQLAVNTQLEREKMAHAAHMASLKPDPKPAGKSA